LPQKTTVLTEQLTHEEPQHQIRERPGRFLGNGACPRAYGAKRVRVRIREKEGFKHPWFWRAPCFWGTHEWELHAVDT